jgi:putative transposase
VLDALEQAIYARRGHALTGLVHHSDRGTQYLSMRYTDNLANAGIAPSVGSQGDAFDNALAESVIALYKTGVIRRQRPWRSLEAVEFCDAGVGGLVQHAAAARPDRGRAAGRV